MMGVYIKGMEMPDKCGHCRFATAFECEVTKNFITTFNVRQQDCPLVPIPPHGRLIDADALMLKILDYIEEYSDVDEKGWHNLKWCAMKEAEMELNNAPTIIPAEEGE